MSGSAQAPSVPLNVSPMVWLRQPAPIKIGVPRGRWLGVFFGRIYLQLLDRTVKMRENNRAKKAFSQTGEGVERVARRMSGERNRLYVLESVPTKRLLLEEKLSARAD